MRTIHAEQNALNQAARFGIALNGSSIYCKMEPCRTCAMSIVAVGIVRVVCEKKYHAAADSREIFARSAVELVVLSDETEEYLD